jgi:hypothetical protein
MGGYPDLLYKLLLMFSVQVIFKEEEIHVGLLFGAHETNFGYRYIHHSSYA